MLVGCCYFRLSLEYRNEVWECNKEQANAVLLRGAKKILGCSRTCNEAVGGDMGLDTLKSRRDKAKLNKLASRPENTYL